MRRWSTWLCALGGILLGIAWLLRDHRDGGTVAAWPRHAVTDVAPEQGRAFVAPLPPGAPSADAGGVRATVLENGVPIGRTASHDDIRARGRGLFSFWQGTLYFCSSDDSDPRTNGRRYEVAWASESASSVEWASRWCGRLGLGAGALMLLGSLLGGRFARSRPRMSRRTLLKLALVTASLCLSAAAVEAWLRIRYPFADSTWPGRFDPRFGFAFEPHAVVRQTNLFDFCVEQQANSLGFLDREPAPRDPGVERIVVLGDSFVAAVEVSIADKFHVLLEQRLQQRGIAATTAAFGMNGCGTSNELAFYEALARPGAHPGDLVIALVAFNDFANNSPLLEALRNGWSPAHAPRLFFRRDGDGFARMPIDPEWASWVELATPAPPANGLLRWSRLWRWIDSSVRHIGAEKQRDHRAAVARRLQQLRSDPVHAELLAGWRFPDDPDIDAMTKVVDPPAAFRESLSLTEHSLAALRDAVTADGGRLLVVACHHLGIQSNEPMSRQFHRGSWLGLLQPMCERLHLPLLDLHERFAAHGILDQVTFARDHHWNELGHAHAARAIDEYLQRHPELLGRR